MLKKLIPYVAVVVSIVGCATNSVTGRSQLNLVTEERAQAMGRESYEKVISEYQKAGKIVSSGATFHRVTEITNRLIDQAVKIHPESADWQWEVNVIDEDTLNAWCMPGGKMAVYTGIVDKLQLTDDELAAIIGHEISHALGGHGREKMSVQMMSGLAVALIAVAAGKNDPNRQDLYYGVGTTLSAVAVTLPNSREKEYEADRMGIELASRAGFDPAGAANVWIKMGRESSGSGPDFLSTHPSGDNRINELRALEVQMLSVQADAKSKGVTTSAPNPWISNAANGYAGFSKYSYLASVEKEQLLTYNFGGDKKVGSVDDFGRGEVSVASISPNQSQSSLSANSIVEPEKSIGQRLGIALGVLAGRNPTSSTSALSNNKAGNTTEQSSNQAIDGGQKNGFSSTEVVESRATLSDKVKSSIDSGVASQPHLSSFPINKSLVAGKSTLTCELNCEHLTIENSNKLQWAIDNRNWPVVEQTILRMNSNSDSSYYWLAVSTWERGFVELATVYFERSLELNLLSANSCGRGSSMPCFGVNVKESVKRYLDATTYQTLTANP